VGGWPRVKRCYRPPALVTVGLAMFLAGCAPLQRVHVGGGTTGPAIPVGSSSHAITVAGVSRTFRVYRPAVLPAAAPLVVMLHGGFGTGAQAERSSSGGSSPRTRAPGPADRLPPPRDRRFRRAALCKMSSLVFV